jgi:glutamate synthase domain-containing protein 2
MNKVGGKSNTGEGGMNCMQVMMQMLYLHSLCCFLQSKHRYDLF